MAGPRPNGGAMHGSEYLQSPFHPLLEHASGWYNSCMQHDTPQLPPLAWSNIHPKLAKTQHPHAIT
jgi:hypothetical protein